jgi:endo-1,4-beta-xylanase
MAFGPALALRGKAWAKSGPSPCLAATASNKGRFYGAAVRAGQIGPGGDLRDLTLGQCNFLTPEIAMIWHVMEPSRGEVSFVRMDAVADFARANRMKVLGHQLLWHLGAPAWAAQALAEEKDWRLIQRHFASVIPRYADTVQLWNVVNEPIDVGVRADGLRSNAFLTAFGPDYIPRALEEARALAPDSDLMINEFSLEYDSPVERERRYAFLKLIEHLKYVGAPLDCIGLQAHLDLRKGRVSPQSINDFIRDVSAFGLDVMVTELDVKESAYADPVEIRDQLVADEVSRYLDVVLDHPAVVGVVTWGLSDRHSWLEVEKEDYARFPGAWKTGVGPGLNRGLPYDSDLRPKPMRQAIARALEV